MYKENWIQLQRQVPVYCYESCSLAHEAKQAQIWWYDFTIPDEVAHITVGLIEQAH